MEQEFFEAFGIEPKWDGGNVGATFYPEITPEIVLKLIKILLKSSNEFHINISKNEFGCNQGYIGGYYEQTFEQSILSLCIEAKDEIQDQVRALFND